MSEFEYFFAFIAILLGLALGAIISKLGDALSARRNLHLGWLSPLLALVVLLDITSFFVWIWSARAFFTTSWMSMNGGTLMALGYFLAATLIFPRNLDAVASLDDHYRDNKRLVIGALIAINAVAYALQLWRVLPALSDVWFFFWFGLFWVPMIALYFGHSKRLEVILMLVLIFQALVPGTGLLPGSQWATTLGLYGPVADPAAVRHSPSTTTSPISK